MTEHHSSRPRVAVIGGGISGLSAARRLVELLPQVELRLFESSERLGGVIRTDRSGDYLIEGGADMFTTKESAGVELCRRLGMDRELIGTNSAHARAFVVHRGRLCPVPEGFVLMSPRKAWPIATTSLLSVAAKLRIAGEYLVPRRTDPSDESLEDFAIRRLGREAYERLVQPLIGGIYTADPTKLSMQAALPQFVEMEREHGGLIRSVLKSPAPAKSLPAAGSGARYQLFVAPEHGMQSLIDGLAASLPADSIRLNQPIRAIEAAPEPSWKLLGNSMPTSEPFDAVILASPAYHAGQLLQPICPTAAEVLSKIEYASASIVALGYRRDQIRHPLNGFGVVVPRKERRGILAASLSSVKFVGRAAGDRVLIRVFIGGACQPELAALPDDELLQLAQRELSELLGAGTPEMSRIYRWSRAMPQYHLGHLDRVAELERTVAAIPRLALAGNAYRGVGIPACIRSGEHAAEVIARQLEVAGSGSPLKTE